MHFFCGVISYEISLHWYTLKKFRYYKIFGYSHACALIFCSRTVVENQEYVDFLLFRSALKSCPNSQIFHCLESQHLEIK